MFCVFCSIKQYLQRPLWGGGGELERIKNSSFYGVAKEKVTLPDCWLKICTVVFFHSGSFFCYLPAPLGVWCVFFPAVKEPEGPAHTESDMGGGLSHQAKVSSFPLTPTLTGNEPGS